MKSNKGSLATFFKDARHLLELINEILDISKIESGRLELKRESFDFNTCVEEVMAGIRHQAADAKTFILEPDSFNVPGAGSRPPSHQGGPVNLLSNAVKFTPEKRPCW